MASTTPFVAKNAAALPELLQNRVVFKSSSSSLESRISDGHYRVFSYGKEVATLCIETGSLEFNAPPPCQTGVKHLELCKANLKPGIEPVPCYRDNPWRRHSQVPYKPKVNNEVFEAADVVFKSPQTIRRGSWTI